MAEYELDSLIKKIHQDGIEKARQEAERIISEAKVRAEEIINRARDEANRIVSEARKEAELFQHRAIKSVEHAARDIILTLSSRITGLFERLLREEVEKIQDVKLTGELIVDIIKFYINSMEEDVEISVIVPDSYKKAIYEFLRQKLIDIGKYKGIEITADKDLKSGFKVWLKGRGIEHDFTSEAITEAIVALLKPQIGEIIKAIRNG